MQHCSFKKHWIPIFCLILGLCACGSRESASSPVMHSAATPTTSTMGTTVPVQRQRPTPQPTAVATLLPLTGAVVLETTASFYHPGDTITVLIKNQTAHTLYFSDHRTACSVLFLQHEVGGRWVEFDLCKLQTPTRLLSLPSAHSLAVTFATSAQWPAGTWRAMLTYSESASLAEEPGQIKVAYSTPFRFS